MQGKSHRASGSNYVVRRFATGRIAAALLLLTALGAAGVVAAESIARSTTQSNATVSLRKTSLGMILVTSKGRTLYLFGKDRNGKSACSASCAQFWPPLLDRTKPTAGRGVKASLLGTTKRSNGSVQVTYNKHPLYTYSLDKRAGQTSGEGVSAFGAKWYVLSAKGAAVIKAPPAPTTSTYTTPYPP